MKDQDISIEQRIDQAAAALIRGEDANWELARLTHESTYRRSDPAEVKAERVSVEDWCERVRTASRRTFATQTGYAYREVWERNQFHDTRTRPSWSDAYYQVLGKTAKESFARLNAETTIKNIGLLAAESKRALVDELTKDPEVEQRLERKFVEKAAKDHGLAARVQRQYEEQNPAPIKPKRPVSGWSFIIGLGVGSETVVALEKQREDVEALVAYLDQHGIEPEQHAAIESILDRFDKARGLIAEYQDMIRAAIGSDYEATFRRLVEGAER